MSANQVICCIDKQFFRIQQSGGGKIFCASLFAE